MVPGLCPPTVHLPLWMNVGLGGGSGMFVLAETRHKCGVQGEYHPHLCKVELLPCSI